MRAVISRTTLLVLLVACGDPAARVTLEPVDLGDCGKPARASVSSMQVIAYTRGGDKPKGVPLDGAPLAISDLPANTEQLGVQLLAPTGVVAEGKTAPLDFANLPDGAAIPIAVLPADGFCRVGDHVARTAPLVARAGNGALVVGGTDGAGNPLASAEYYDATTTAFTAVDPGIDLGPTGFSGFALTELTDGTVLATGPGHVALLFDPKTRTFQSSELAELRAWHAAIEIDGQFVIAGGCSDVPCVSPLASTFRYPLDKLDKITARVSCPLLGNATQQGARAFDLGIQTDGVHRIAIAGGIAAPATGDRFGCDDTTSTELQGLHAQPALLDGGVLLTAFDPDGSPQTGAVNIVPPDATAPLAVNFAPTLDRPRVVALEDGSVLAIGSAVARYVPTTDLWQPIAATAGGPANAAAPGPVAAPALVRLPDGAVLVLAGASAWLYRPSLVGASSGQVAWSNEPGSDGVLTPSNPATVSRATGLTLSSLRQLDARLLVGGPRTATGSVSARVRVRASGVALIAQQLGPGRALVGELFPGDTAKLVRLDGGMATVRCTGRMVDAFDPGSDTIVALAIAGTTATLSRDGASVASCDLSSDPDIADRGAWGIAALGPDDGSQPTTVDIIAITVSR